MTLSPQRAAEAPSRILVAEDSRTQAEQLAFLLEENGFAVEVAANGKLALAAANARRPDLVISDVMMPEMDGYTFCRALKASGSLRTVPLILVTSMSTPHDVVRGLECGADNFITKPYDERYLLARVRYLLTNAALRAGSVVRSGIEIDLEGERIFVTAERQQILDLLISTYATAVRFSNEAVDRERMLRESYETMKVLYRSAEGLNQAKNEAAVVAEALERCRDFPFVRSCWIWLDDPDGKIGKLEAAGLPPQTAERLSAPGPCSCQEALASGRLTSASNFAACEKLAAGSDQANAAPYHASIPLLGRWRPLGVLNVIGKDDERPLSEEELRALSAIGNQLAAALDRAQLHDSLERQVEKRTAELRLEMAEREAAQSASRQATARLERAVRGSSAGLWEWDLRTDQAYYSPRFKSLLGYGDEDEATTTSFFYSALHPEDSERTLSLIRRHIADGTRLASEFRLRLKDGSYRWFSGIGEATRDDAGEAAIMAGSITDVTERRGIEEQLHQVQKMEAIGNLTGGIAHDFNNMLAVVIGNLDLLRLELKDNPEALDFVDTALSASLRGSELTKSLLAFARKQPLQPRLVELGTLLGESEKLLTRALGANIAIKFSVPAEVWSVHADPAQIEAALFNLAINARDAMPNGGTIIVSASNATLDTAYCQQNPDVHPGDYVALEVSDTGEGMTPEVLKRIFEPFFTTKGKGKGTGLGLAMVFGFAKQSGGHVKVYSEVGHGTTVRLYLPRGVAEVRDASRRNGAAAQASKGGGERILIVEDNLLVRRAAVKQLKGAGYRLLEAGNVADALAMLEQADAVDLVFSDVIMPGEMNGGDLAREVRRRWPNTKVLLTSGFAQGLLEDGNRVPEDVSLLGKPYRMEDLFRKLREVLDSAPG